MTILLSLELLEKKNKILKFFRYSFVDLFNDVIENKRHFTIATFHSSQRDNIIPILQMSILLHRCTGITLLIIF